MRNSAIITMAFGGRGDRWWYSTRLGSGHHAHQMGLTHIKGDKLVWQPHKTLRSTAKQLSIRIRPELRAALDAAPARADGVTTSIVNEYGRPFASAAAFGNRFADWCRMAGLKPVLCDDGKVRSY